MDQRKEHFRAVNICCILSGYSPEMWHILYSQQQSVRLFASCLMALVSKEYFSDSFATPWTVARQAPLSMGFPRQKYWSGLPFPSPGDLPDAGLNPDLPHWQADSLPLSHQESPSSAFTSSLTEHLSCIGHFAEFWRYSEIKVIWTVNDARKE